MPELYLSSCLWSNHPLACLRKYLLANCSGFIMMDKAEKTTNFVRFSTHALSFYQKGFRGLVPVSPESKAAISGWPNAGSWDKDKLEAMVDKYRGGYGIGIVSGCGVAAIDIDILDENLAERAKNIIFEHCGQSDFIRIGQYPKIAIFYRGTKVPYRKHPYGLPIEIYGGKGKTAGHIVIHGTHAKTRNDYHWPNRSFIDIKSIDDLPALDPDTLDAALEEIATELSSLTRTSTLGGEIDIDQEGIGVDTARQVWKLKGDLTEWMLNAEEGTRHATMLAALSFLHGAEFSQEKYSRHPAELNQSQILDRARHINEVYRGFLKAKPEQSARTEFERAASWVDANIEDPSIKARAEYLNEFDVDDKPAGFVRFGREAEALTYQHGPDCFVDNLFYADVSILTGAGGSHKTTIAIREAIQTALGKPLWGHKTFYPMKTLMVSAEDETNTILAKISRMINGMRSRNEIEEDEVDLVWQRVGVAYVGSDDFTLSRIDDDVVVNHKGSIETITDAIEENGFHRVIFDPAISFGVGEQRTNDAEQGLIKAARVIRGNNCMVEFVSHTGKQNARGRTVDQYSSRGGSALPDGSRLVRVVHGYNYGVEEEVEAWKELTGMELTEDQSGVAIHVGKNTWGKNRTTTYLIRENWYFYEIDIEATRRKAKLKADIEKMAALFEFLKAWPNLDEISPRKIARLPAEEFEPLREAGVAARNLYEVWNTMEELGYIGAKRNEQDAIQGVVLHKHPRADLAEEF